MDNTDKFLLVGTPGTATTLAGAGYTTGDSSITVESTANWPSSTAVAFAIDTVTVVDGKEVQVPGSYVEFVGIVADGTTINSIAVSSYSPNADRNFPSGSTTRVYIPVSATQTNRIIEGIKVSLNPDGTIKDNIITSAKFVDGAVTPEKLVAGTGADWDYQDWTPTYTSLSNPNGTITAKYTRVGNKISGYWLFDIGDVAAVGNGFTVSLPTPAKAIYGTNTFLAPVGVATARDTGTALYLGTVVLNNPSTMTVYWSTGTTGQGTTIFPFSEGTADYVAIQFEYEVA